MEGGDAESWKTSFLKRKASSITDTINFGKWGDFLTDLRKSFQPYDKKGDAIDEIIKLRQGAGSIEDHVARFKVLLELRGGRELPGCPRLLHEVSPDPTLKKDPGPVRPTRNLGEMVRVGPQVQRQLPSATTNP